MSDGNTVTIPCNASPAGQAAPANMFKNDIVNGHLYFSKNGVLAQLDGGGGGSVSLTGTDGVIVTPNPITGTGVISLANPIYVYSITLTSPQLLEFNNNNTLSSVVASSATYVGVFPNGAGGALIGGVYTVSGFTNSSNNGVFVCTNSSTTNLVLNNPSAIDETAVAAALNDGFVVPYIPPSGTWWNVERGIAQFNFNTTSYTLGSEDCVFEANYLTALVNVDDEAINIFFQATGLVDQTVKTVQPAINSSLSINYLIMLDNVSIPLSGVQDSLLYISFIGTTPTLTAGDGTLTIQLTLQSIPNLS